MQRFSCVLVALFASSLFLCRHGALGVLPSMGDNNNQVDEDIESTLNGKVAQQMFAVGYIVVNENELAHRMSKALLVDQLVASVNVLPGVQSIAPALPQAQGEGSMVVFVTRVVNVPLIKVLLEAEMIMAEEGAPYYQILFTVLADVNGEYLEFIDKHTIDARKIGPKKTTTTTTKKTSTVTTPHITTTKSHGHHKHEAEDPLDNDNDEGDDNEEMSMNSVYTSHKKTKTSTTTTTNEDDDVATTVTPASTPQKSTTGSVTKTETLIPTRAETVQETAAMTTVENHGTTVGSNGKTTNPSATTSLRRRLSTSTVTKSQIVDLATFDGTDIRLITKRGQLLTLQVKVNSGTGYTWKVSTHGTTLNHIEGPIDVPEQENTFPGAPHFFWFHLTPEDSGTVALSLVSPTQVVVRTITVSIVVA